MIFGKQAFELKQELDIRITLSIMLCCRRREVQPRRQAVVWRPAVLLQQAGQARHERHGRRHRQVQTQAVATYWCGENSNNNNNHFLLK